MVYIPAKVISEGRVTLPMHIRKELDIEAGDVVLVDVRPLSEAVEVDESAVDADADAPEVEQ